MRWLILVFSGFWFSLAVAADQFRVTTWNLEWFPSGSPNLAAPEIEAERIEKAAAVLAEINPDVILLQEIRDSETCEKLAVALKPEHYQVAVCSAFRDAVGGTIGRQQVAILSKKEPLASFAEKWKTFGAVDPPRGFAFALIRVGTNDVAFYSVHLKSNLTKGYAQRENQFNILKREIAAEQLIRHVAEISAKLTNQIEAILIGGDFNTHLDNPLFASENTLRLLQKEGFSSGFENVPLQDRITCLGKGRYPDATFDYVFARGAKSADSPKITQAALCDHNPVTYELHLKSGAKGIR